MKRLAHTNAYLFAEVIKHANDVVVVTDATTGHIVYVNTAFTALTGVSAAAALGQSPGKLLQGPDTCQETVTQVRDALRRGEGIRTEILNYDLRGREYWLDMNIVPLRDEEGRLTHFAAIERDVTEQRRAQEVLRLMACTDVLTGLANRRSLEGALQREILNMRRENAPLALLAFDIDHFKRINDSHGHAAGDLVLREVTRRCSRLLRPRDLLARVGGEEFLMLLPGADSHQGALVAERLRRAIAADPVMVMGQSVCVTASFGVTLYQGRDDNPGAGLSRADRLMYAAKSAGRNRVCADQRPAAGLQAPIPAQTSGSEPESPFQ